MKKYFAGLLTGVLLMASIPAFAETSSYINVIFDRVKLVVNGEKTDTTTILYDGRTYVQLKGAAEAFGANLEWDGATNTAKLITTNSPPSNTSSNANQESDFKYIIDNNQVTITGYKGLGVVVTIPQTIEGKPVTMIKSTAFQFNSNIISVTMPSSLISIGEEAFWGCSSLSSVIIPNGVINIGTRAFLNCTGLTSITIPGSVKSIGSLAFGYCDNLKSAYFEGDAPAASDPFTYSPKSLVVYYHSDKSGWSTTWYDYKTSKY